MVGQLYGLTPAERRRRATDVLERIRMVDAADRQVKTYSGGMRRRHDLAASLVGRPRVVFLDAPTTGLDPDSPSDLWGLSTGSVADGSTPLHTTNALDGGDPHAERTPVNPAGPEQH